MHVGRVAAVRHWVDDRFEEVGRRYARIWTGRADPARCVQGGRLGSARREVVRLEREKRRSLTPEEIRSVVRDYDVDEFELTRPTR